MNMASACVDRDRKSKGPFVRQFEPVANFFKVSSRFV
jgi:hypothetical protein